MIPYQNNYYPTYQQQYPQPIQMPQPIPQPQMVQPQNQILAWVKDEKEALDFPLSAGQSIFLMSQNEPYLYMKSVDQLGKSTFLKKRLVDESDNSTPQVDLTDYIKREEIENLITDRIQREVEKKMSEISFKKTHIYKLQLNTSFSLIFLNYLTSYFSLNQLISVT